MPGQFIDAPAPAAATPAPQAGTGQFIDAPGPLGMTEKGAKPGHGPLDRAEHAVGNVVRPIEGGLMKAAGSGLGVVGNVLGTPQRFVAGMQHDKGPGDFEGIYDAFHPNDHARLDKVEEDNMSDMSGGASRRLTGLPKAAAHLGYQTASDPLTIAGGPIVKGVLKGASSLAKLIPGSEAAISAARMPFIGSSHLDKAGITGSQKVQFKGIEGSEHGRMKRNVSDFEQNIGKHLNKNPANPPDYMTPGVITDTRGGPVVAQKRTVDFGKGNSVRIPDEAHQQHGQKMMANSVYRDSYGAAIKGGADHKQAMKAANDTVESIAPDVDLGKVRDPEASVKAPGSPQDAGNGKPGYNVPLDSSTGQKEAAKVTAPVQQPGQSDAEFAKRQFDHLYNTDDDFHNAYDYHKKMNPDANIQQAAVAGARAMFHKHRALAVTSRAEDMGISKSAAQAGLEGFSKNKDQGTFGKMSRAIGDAQKGGMFINPLPHVLGNVGQNSFLSTGLKGLANASKYTMNPKSINPRTISRMEEYGADHSNFDPLETLDEPDPNDTPLQKLAGNISRKSASFGDDAQKFLGSNKLLNNSETGARASAWEHFEQEAAKKHGVDMDQLTPEQLHEVGQQTRSAIGDYRNKSDFVKKLENRFGAQFPQYRAIAVGNTARAAANNPARLESIYRAQDDTNKDVIQDPKSEYTLGGLANAGNKAFSSPSDYARGASAIGPVASALLNIAGIPNANIAGSVPGGAGGGYSSSTPMHRAGEQAVEMGTNTLPAGGNAARDAIEDGKNPLTLPSGIETLLDAAGIQKHHEQQPKDIRKIDKWSKTGKPFNEYRDPKPSY